MFAENEPVEFGMFKAILSKAQNDYNDDEAGFILQKGESFLDIQLDLNIPKSTKLLDGNLKHLAYEIKQQNVDVQYVLGVTYGKMAVLTKHFGFSLKEATNLPPDYIQRIEEIYQTSQGAKQGKPMGKLFICFQTQKDYLERFGIVS